MPNDNWAVVTRWTNKVIIYTLQPTDKSYSDLTTSHFPHISCNGYQYFSSSITTIPMPSSHSHQWETVSKQAKHIKAWNHCCNYLKKLGQAPVLHIMDKEETSNNLLLHAIECNKVRMQLVPPHLHRCNAAKQAISTFKNHFIAGLCSINLQFPVNLWADLLPQVELTLNLCLHPCCLNTNKLSVAHTALEGIFDFNTNCTTRNKSSSPPKAHTTKGNLEYPWHQWMVLWPCTSSTALPLRTMLHTFQ